MEQGTCIPADEFPFASVTGGRHSGKKPATAIACACAIFRPLAMRLKLRVREGCPTWTGATKAWFMQPGARPSRNRRGGGVGAVNSPHTSPCALQLSHNTQTNQLLRTRQCQRLQSFHSSIKTYSNTNQNQSHIYK